MPSIEYLDNFELCRKNGKLVISIIQFIIHNAHQAFLSYVVSYGYAVFA